MRTIAVMSQKGGAGKSTTAVHAAVALMQSGLSVILLDTDPQQSSLAWSKARGYADPIVLAVPVLRLAEALAAARADGYEIAIIDTQPRAGPDAVDVARLADLVVIPVRPGAFDFAAVGETIKVVQRAGVPSVLVLNACRSQQRAGEARAALEGTGARVASVAINDRVAFSRALDSGSAVIEFEPRGKAAAEIRALVQEVMQ